MALFADGAACTIGDLTDQDTGLLAVAETCGINVTTKIRLAHEEITRELHLWLDRTGSGTDAVWAPVTQLGQVVVTPPLLQWEIMIALSLVYRDAYFSQLVDRYQPKWEEYAKLARYANQKFIATGVGLVNDPVVQAAPPLVASIAGPQTGGKFYASIAWVNAAGQEGSPSPSASISVADGNLMTVAAADSPARVAGFNVYAGTQLSALFLQNGTVLPAGAMFTYVPGSVVQGRLPGTGQEPDFIRALPRTLLRG